jgi:hypothetical protein
MAGIIGPSILSLRRRIHGSAGQTASSPPTGAPPATRLKALVRDAKGRIVRKFDEDQAAGLYSKYLVSHRVQGQPTSVISAFPRGTVFLDRKTGVVLRITQETSAVPDDFPIRQMSLSLEYGDVPVGGRVYALPLSFTMDVRLRKRALVWNEVSFRSYQRFTADSHFLPARQ